MKEKQIITALVLAAGIAGTGLLYGEPPQKQEGNGVRTIRLLQDDGQIRIVSKVYELKHLKATDIRPFIEAAVKRYSRSSTIERVNYPQAKRQMIIVSTGEDFIPYVDELIAGLDQPGKPGKSGSIIEGTGITRITYVPNYRAAEDLVRLINIGTMGSPEGRAFLNKDTNTIYWKDDKRAALSILAWVKYLDRPVPQVNLRLNYYEIRESKLRDIGLDYLAWKNGPGMDIFSSGFDGGKVFSNEAIWQLINGAYKLADLTRNFSTSWSYGAFFTAPQFDLSFVRILQQSGNAKLAAHADLTFVNTAVYDDPALNTHLPKIYTATLTPGYENIRKDDDDRSSIVESGDSTLTLNVYNPVICFGAAPAEITARGTIPSTEEFYAKNNGGVVFAFRLDSKTVTEKSNRGDELGNTSTVAGELTLGFKTEKLLASYVREQDVEQTVGIPFLVKIPVLKYLFGTTTTVKERTYIIVTAEANLVHPNAKPPKPVSHEVTSNL
ncbi:MAG: hypothetical protein J5806_02745 [Lentisphaeria bacterium]|nr:hypothetical protein [Lentisphaeria bacterium]